MGDTDVFMMERPRLVNLAARVLGDAHEADDVVQQTWMRWHTMSQNVDAPAAWLTTVTTRLCLDRLRSRTPMPVAEPLVERIAEHAAEREVDGTAPDPADSVILADTVGIALQVVLDRLTPRERVAFVLHDTFGFEFSSIGTILGMTPTAVRKLASRARGKVRGPAAAERPADGEVVDAFLAAARGGDFAGLLRLLAPDASIAADAAAVRTGTPEHIEGRQAVATFFNGAAKAALPVLFDDRPAAAWYHRGTARVLFDFAISHGVVRRITFRADPAALARVVRRESATAHGTDIAIETAAGPPVNGVS